MNCFTFMVEWTTYLLIFAIFVYHALVRSYWHKLQKYADWTTIMLLRLSAWKLNGETFSFRSYLILIFIVNCLQDSSRVAQWKRAGPITQRSEDQNLALLIIVFYLQQCLKGVLLPIFTYFASNNLKENHSTDAKHRRTRSTKIRIGN